MTLKELASDGSGEVSELTIPRNLRGRFRGFVRVGGVPERAFQHFKIALSTLNLGVQYTSLFVQYTSPRLVKYCPGSKQAAGLEWLSRSDFEPSCLGGLVRRRLTAKPESRVRVLAWSSPQNPPKIFKIWENRGPVYWTSSLLVALSSLLVILSSLLPFRPVYWTHCVGQCALFPVRHSEVLSGTFAVSLLGLAGDSNLGLGVLSSAP